MAGCADESFDDGIRIDTCLEPISGPGGTVKPAVYEGGKYQRDLRWASPDDDEPTKVVVIDNVPSQANRLEAALQRHVETQRPEFVLDLSGLPNLPAHLPRSLSSLQFPHRNADAYLRDAQLDGKDFFRTDIGRAIFGATAQTCGPLVAWFPQALLYGFWQSHLGKKRQNTKHARAWVSEIVGWRPAPTETTKVLGLKGDPLNLSVEEKVRFRGNDQTEGKLGGDEKKKLSEIGHGQVPFMRENVQKPLPAAAISFARVTQRATLSFAQLRRVSLGGAGASAADAAVRALLAALGLHAHQLAFSRGFALRSGGELRPRATTVTWLGADSDESVDLGSIETTRALLESARKHASSKKVLLDGWGEPATRLTPKPNLSKAIRSTWPELD